MKTKTGKLLLLSVICALSGQQTLSAAPITSNTALPAHEGEFILRAQVKYLRSTDDSTPMNRELSVWSAPSVFVYGLTEKFTLFGIAPYLDKTLYLTTLAGRQTRGVFGLGDMRFLARYTLGQWDKPGETSRLTPFIGLEVPTGEDDQGDSLGRLPQPLQLGSGSWDPVIGTVFTRQTLKRQFDSSISYKFNTAANGFEFGDALNLDLSYQHRIWPRQLGKGVPGYLYAVVESNMIWQDNNKVFGIRDANSGGTTLYLAPGIQYATKRFILETAVQLPVIQDLNGTALENDFIVTAGFRRNF